MQQSELSVSLRERVGKGGARSARRAGLIPGVVYGVDIAATPVLVSPKELTTVLDTDAGINTILTLRAEGQPFNGLNVMVKDEQINPIRRERIHVDFQVVDLKKKGYYMVPVFTVGESAGEKEGATLQLIRVELEVYCLPTKVPGHIEIDVSALEIGDSIHIEDVTAPEDVEFVHDVNFTVVTVVGFRASELDEDEEAAESDVEEAGEQTEDTE
ncbi:MAG: 50S ribosomal protein L25 [Desulfuromonadaceae bacterium]|nr:50S ribosomal protein L25 [Desulfuromonadaceae bacterium]